MDTVLLSTLCNLINTLNYIRGCSGHDRMVVGFITTEVVSSNPAHGDVYSIHSSTSETGCYIYIYYFIPPPPPLSFCNLCCHLFNIYFPLLIDYSISMCIFILPISLSIYYLICRNILYSICSNLFY